MSEAFNPYYTWLGIRPEEQPADHYRLLGLSQFESDADVISNLADGRMAHVRSFQSSKHSAVSQQILNELARARACLLNPTKKAEYDAQLKAQLQRAEQELPVAPPAVPQAPAAAPPLPTPAPAPEPPQSPYHQSPAVPNLVTGPSGYGGRPAKKSTNPLPIIVGGATVVLTLAVLGIVAVVLFMPSGTDVADLPIDSQDPVGVPRDVNSPPTNNNGNGSSGTNNSNPNNGGGNTQTTNGNQRFGQITAAHSGKPVIPTSPDLNQLLSQYRVLDDDGNLLQDPLKHPAGDDTVSFVTRSRPIDVHATRFANRSAYLFDCQVVRLSGNDTIMLGLWVTNSDGTQGKSVQVDLDGFNNAGYRSGVATVNGVTARSDSYPGYFPGRLFEGNKPQRLVAVVLPGKFYIFLAGQPIYSWSGKTSELDYGFPFSGVNPPPDSIYVGSRNSEVAFSDVYVATLQPKVGKFPDASNSPSTEDPDPPTAGTVAVSLSNVHHYYDSGKSQLAIDTIGEDDVFAGTLNLGTSVQTSKDANCVVRLDFPKESAYLLTSDVIRQEGDDTILLGLWATNKDGSGGKTVHIDLDGFKFDGYLSGPAKVDGQLATKQAWSPSQHQHKGQLFQKDERSKLAVLAVPGRFSIYVDDKLIYGWSGKTDRLDYGLPFSGDNMPSPYFIGSRFSQVVFEKLTFTPLTPNENLVADAGSVDPKDSFPPDTTPDMTDPTDPMDPPMPAEQRLPVPAEAAQAKALAEVKQLFADEFASKDRDENAALAAQLLSIAKDTDDATSRFALFIASRDLAAAGGDVKSAVKAADLLAEMYALDRYTELHLAIEAAANNAISNQREDVSMEAVRISKLANAQGSHDVAEKLAVLAYTVAAKTSDVELRNFTRDWRDKLREILAKRKEADAALAILAENPNDPQANLAVGIHMGLEGRNMNQGAPYLAKGSDPKLAALAKMEMEQPEEPDAVLALADGWWELAQSQPEYADGARQRAVLLYRQVRSQLSPLQKVKVDRILEEATK